MVRPEGFELPTYRFVACCSIQLSYERLVKMDMSRASEKRQAFFCLFRRKRPAFCGKPSDCHGVVRPERFELPTHRFVACCSIQLSHERPTTANIGKTPVTVKRFFACSFFFSAVRAERSPPEGFACPLLCRNPEFRLDHAENVS